MNEVFQPYLRQFVLVFFDDILIYNSSLTLYVKHLEQVFIVLRKQKLYAKLSKCVFAQSELEYLGHVINENGVPTDYQKV